MTPEVLAATRDTIRPEQVAHDARIVTEFIDYIRWLADQDAGFRMSAGDLWALYHDGVIKCRYWLEVCEELGLPVRDEW